MRGLGYAPPELRGNPDPFDWVAGGGGFDPFYSRGQGAQYGRPDAGSSGTFGGYGMTAPGSVGARGMAPTPGPSVGPGGGFAPTGYDAMGFPVLGMGGASSSGLMFVVLLLVLVALL